MEKNRQKIQPIHKIIVLVILVIVLVLGPLVYFFSWRPSDSDYQQANAYLDEMQGTAKTVAVELSAVPNPGVINQTTVIKLQILSDVYKKSHTAFVQSPVVGRDFSVGPIYNKHKDVLDRYNQSVIDLAESTKLYVSVLDECKKVTDSLLAGYNEDYFDTLMKECRESLSKGADSKYEPFNALFFDKYLQQTSKYMDTVERMTKATTNTETDKAVKEADVLYESIYELGTIEMSFDLPDVSSAYKDLSSVIDSQKSAFLR